MLKLFSITIGDILRNFTILFSSPPKNHYFSGSNFSSQALNIPTPLQRNTLLLYYNYYIPFQHCSLPFYIVSSVENTCTLFTPSLLFPRNPLRGSIHSCIVYDCVQLLSVWLDKWMTSTLPGHPLTGL